MITAAVAALVVLGVPAASASATWAVQPTPTPFHGVDGMLEAVSCLSADNCFAVGGYTSPFAQVTLAEHWNGTKWAIRATPNPSGATFSNLDGISCTAATDCTAVGEYESGTGFTTLPLAEHWNGRAWTIQAMPAPSGGFGINVSAVACPSAASCTAVGWYFKQSGPGLTLAEHWNGNTWAVQPMPSPSPVASSAQLYGVSCTAPGTCKAVGFFHRAGARVDVTLAESLNAGTWRVRSTRGPSATPGELRGVSCLARNDCIAVGTSGTGAALAEHWDGSAWTVQATPGPPDGILNGISCTSAANCVAVGNAPVTGINEAALAESWDGTAWTVEATASPVAEEQLNGVSCTSASICTAAGLHIQTFTHGSSPLAEQRS